MSNDYFRFKQFIVQQQHCAMKVGTDGCMLGAWAHGGARILDVGTGTGLLALMMAQRFPLASITALDIDPMAVGQARQNVAASPFASRIHVCMADFSKDNQALPSTDYDAIICNPPFFADSLQCPDMQRTVARHTSALSYQQLMSHASQLLSKQGMLSVIVPFDCRSRMEEAAALSGLVLTRLCAVRTTERKPPRRYLLAFSPCSDTAPETSEIVIGSPQFNELLRDFYLKL